MIYKYCDKCGRPVEEDNTDNTDNKYTFCLDCALELYQKLFCNESKEPH